MTGKHKMVYLQAWITCLSGKIKINSTLMCCFNMLHYRDYNTYMYSILYLNEYYNTLNEILLVFFLSVEKLSYQHLYSSISSLNLYAVLDFTLKYSYFSSWITSVIVTIKFSNSIQFSHITSMKNIKNVRFFHESPRITK